MMRALIIGASGGIGSGVKTALTEQGYDVLALSRKSHGFDFKDSGHVQELLSRISGTFDLIFVCSGVLTETIERPEKSLAELSADEMAAQFAVNTIGPALVLQAARRLLPKKGRSVFAALSARVGSIEDNRLGGWYSYRASKAALNQVIKTGSVELARTHKEAICVALHPGTVATSFTQDFARPDKLQPEESAKQLLNVINRLDASDTGSFFDWKGERVPW